MKPNTHIPVRVPILRGKTPDLVRKEIQGLMLVHYAECHLLYYAVREADDDVDR